MLRRPSAPQWISKWQNIFGTFQIECEKFWTFWKFLIFHEKITKIMKNHERSWKSWNSWKNQIFSKNSEKSWKIKNFQKVQNFSHSIWKVPKMFCHLEIHWGALGRRNIGHDYRWTKFLQKVVFFKNNDTSAVDSCLNLRWRLMYRYEELVYRTVWQCRT